MLALDLETTDQPMFFPSWKLQFPAEELSVPVDPLKQTSDLWEDMDLESNKEGSTTAVWDEDKDKPEFVPTWLL